MFIKNNCLAYLEMEEGSMYIQVNKVPVSDWSNANFVLHDLRDFCGLYDHRRDLNTVTSPAWFQINKYSKENIYVSAHMNLLGIIIHFLYRETWLDDYYKSTRPQVA